MIIEAELEPALNVEEEAKGRLKSHLKDQNLPVESIIALIYPETLRQASNLKSALAQTRLRYCVFYANNDRFPKTGWLEGFAHDLADLIDLVAVPKSAFDKATDTLMAGIDGAVSVLENSAVIHLTDEIFSLLGLADVIQTQRIPEAKKRELKNTQTRRIAGAIIANALIFHERIAGVHKPKQTTSKAWQNILAINYRTRLYHQPRHSPPTPIGNGVRHLALFDKPDPNPSIYSARSLLIVPG